MKAWSSVKLPTWGDESKKSAILGRREHPVSIPLGGEFPETASFKMDIVYPWAMMCGVN